MSDEGEGPRTPPVAAPANAPVRAAPARTTSVTSSLPFGKRVQFAWLRLRWQWWVGVRRVGMFTRRHAGAIRRTLMVLAGLGLGVLADFFGAEYIPKSDLANYLVATGAMIGGTTAIVFSISLFLLQGVSDMYSSRHLEDYVNHWRDQLIFPTIIVIALVFFATALYVASLTTLSSASASVIIAASLLLVGGVFGLIDQQYEAVRRKVSPARVIGFLWTKANAFLRQIERDAAQIAAMVSVPAQGMTQDEAVALVYNKVLGSLVTDLGLQTELLVDIALRLAERQEVEMARRSLEAVGELLARYLRARRTSSLAFPSPRALLATESDSQSFLAARFEQLNRAGLTFIHAGQDDLAAQVVEVYRSVATAAKDIKSLGLTSENPILESAMWSLNSYMKDGLAERNEEVVFQGSDVLMKVGLIAVETGNDTLVLAVQERLHEFGTVGLGFNNTVVFDRVAAGLLAILDAAFRGQLVNPTFAVERSLQGIEAMLAALTGVLAANYIKNDFSTSQALMMTYTQLHEIVDRTVARYETFAEDTKRGNRRDLVMLFDELRRHFRNMTKHVRADSLTAGSIGRSIFHVNDIIIALLKLDEFGDIARELRNALTALCHVPYWFLAETASFDANDGTITTLVEAVAKTGILAWQANERDVVGQCIHAIDAMARAAVEKGTGISGYAQARMMDRASYLGILARRSGWGDVVTDLKTRLDTFETAFVQKYLEKAEGLPDDFDPYRHHIGGLPHANQVALDLLNFAERFDYERLNGVHIMHDAEDLMYEITNEAEIREFLRAMWGIE